MLAVQVRQTGPVKDLAVEDVADLAPGAREVVVDVKAKAINYAGRASTCGHGRSVEAWAPHYAAAADISHCAILAGAPDAGRSESGGTAGLDHGLTSVSKGGRAGRAKVNESAHSKYHLRALNWGENIEERD